MKNLKLLSIIIVLPAALSITACTSVQTHHAQFKYSFHGKATALKNSSPIPVEIARDIERITEDGMLVMNPDATTSMGLAAISDKLDQLESKFQDGQRGLANSNSCSHHSHSDHVHTHSHSPEQSQVQAAKPYRKKSINRKKGRLLAGNKGPLTRNKRGRIGALTNYKQNLEPLQGGKTVSYIVKLGDTLMKIAFEKYANYLRWKDIYQLNKNKMISPRKMKVGTELTIANVKYVYIKRDGKPYLIKKEDTLKSISKKLYGSENKWKDIWKNNPQLIQNPKKIYAGFSLYYKPDQGKVEFLRVPADEGEGSTN